MESINSEQKIGIAQLKRGEAPKHNAAGHEMCAYYNPITETWTVKTPVPLICEHGMPATGAFYNEDYIRRLRQISHQIISTSDSMVVQKDLRKLVDELRELTR